MSDGVGVDVREDQLPAAALDRASNDWAPASPIRAFVTPPVATAGERPRKRFARRAHRARLYLYSFMGVALLTYVVALASTNTRRVQVHWVLGTSSISLVWLVLPTAIAGWLLGLATAGAFRWRTRLTHAQPSTEDRIR
jgi:uncharacterized integral membrane protein